MSHFFQMGGYAVYVWGAYSLGAVVLIGNLWLTHRAKRRLWRRLLEM